MVGAMTVTSMGPTWWASDIRSEHVAAVIRDAFPSVRSVYFGHATRRWWALVGDRMVEAADPDQLYRQIRATRPSAPPPWPSVGPDGRATPRSPLPLFEPRPGRLRRILDLCHRVMGSAHDSK